MLAAVVGRDSVFLFKVFLEILVIGRVFPLRDDGFPDFHSPAIFIIRNECLLPLRVPYRGRVAVSGVFAVYSLVFGQIGDCEVILCTNQIALMAYFVKVLPVAVVFFARVRVDGIYYYVVE